MQCFRQRPKAFLNVHYRLAVGLHSSGEIGSEQEIHQCRSGGTRKTELSNKNLGGMIRVEHARLCFTSGEFQSKGLSSTDLHIRPI